MTRLTSSYCLLQLEHFRDRWCDQCPGSLGLVRFRSAQLCLHMVSLSGVERKGADIRPAVFTIDTYGRRALNLFFFPQMAWSLFVAGKSHPLPTAH